MCPLRGLTEATSGRVTSAAAAMSRLPGKPMICERTYSERMECTYAERMGCTYSERMGCIYTLILSSHVLSSSSYPLFLLISLTSFFLGIFYPSSFSSLSIFLHFSHILLFSSYFPPIFQVFFLSRWQWVASGQTKPTRASQGSCGLPRSRRLRHQTASGR